MTTLTPTPRTAGLALAAAALALACSKAPEPETKPAAHDAPAPRGEHEAPRPPGAAANDVAYQRPARWHDAPNPSPMRKATFKIPKAEGDPDDAEMSVTQVGGGVTANVERWKNQFEATGAPVQSEKTVNGLKVTLVEIHGTFKGGGMPGGPPAAPKPGWALLGVIANTSTPTFFKLTGPEKTVAAAKPELEAFVNGFKPK